MMKDIPGYEGTYKINECGNVINKNGHLMRTAVSNSGYIRTALENPVTGERKNKSIHRLVAKQLATPLEENDANIELLEQEIELTKNSITAIAITKGIQILTTY